MKKITIICFLAFSIIGFTQESKSLEGYYNLSEFEMAARLFLLDNNTFYYSAIFGSVDLEIYGEYTIKDNQLHFYPQKEQMQTFILYGRENKSSKGTIELNYYKPEGSYRSLVVIGTDKQWVKRPIEQANNDEIKIVIKQQHITTLKIGYPTYFDRVGRFFQVTKVISAKIPKGNNDFVLSYNRYADMRQQFSKKPIQLKEDALVNGDKIRQMRPLQEGEREKIMTFFKENKMFEPIIESRGNVFQQILLATENSKPKLQKNKKGQLEEIITYTKDGVKNEAGIYCKDKGQLKEIITIKNEVKTGERKWYFENGQLAETGKFKNSLKEGEWNNYYKNGQQRLIKNYKDDLKQGEWKSFFPNGQLEEIGIYVADKKEGEWKTYYENEQLKEIETYKNGERAGISKTYYKNGQLKRISEYKGYTEIGNYEYYEEDGHLSSKGIFNEKGEKTGEWKSYHYGSGKLWTAGKFIDGKSIGEHKSFYEDGNLEKLSVYTNEGADATHISFHKNGIIKEKREVEKGEYTGEWTTYFENGQLKARHFYNQEGKSTGESKYYYENGQLSSSSNYKNGDREGEEKRYSESGQLIEIGNYKNGSETGIWKYYYGNGQLRKTGTRTKFDDIGEWKFYYESGQLKRVGTYNDSEGRIGKWTDYHENGKLQVIVNYNENGSRIGETKFYHDNGQLSMVEYYDTNGDSIGEWKHYDKNGKLTRSATFKDGELIGKWKDYDKNGN